MLAPVQYERMVQGLAPVQHVGMVQEIRSVIHFTQKAKARNNTDTAMESMMHSIPKEMPPVNEVSIIGMQGGNLGMNDITLEQRQSTHGSVFEKPDWV